MDREAERKRLLELLKEFCHCKNEDCEKCRNNGTCFLCQIVNHFLDNGVNTPPVKAGQTIYVIYDKKVYEAVAEQVSTICHISGKKLTRIKAEFDVEDWFYKDGRKTKYGIFVFYPEEVFLTREEALAKLKGGEQK